MKHKNLLSLAAAVCLTTAVALPASAYDAGDWTFKAGLTNVDPEQTNGDTAVGELVIDDDSSLSLLGSYFVADNVAIELLASLPFEHDWTVGGLVGGSVQHLPPTLSLQYYFNNNSPFVPYVGLGLNYTIFFSEEAFGDLAGANVDIEDSFGIAAQVGADYNFTDQLFMNLDVRYIQIESDVKVNGTVIGEAEINPLVVGINVGYRF
ncbi:MAG: OmpW family outer membrane protein [Gammaproteobacteria bacterium]|jgi:outer membrane protein|nr:OmpW family outer membrane protein [Gammaproteobacteria bacterium]